MNRRNFLKALAAAGVVVTAPRVAAFVEDRESFTQADVQAMVEVYVDPAINKPNGKGTQDEPYGTLEFAIEQVQFNPLRGNRINIKASS